MDQFTKWAKTEYPLAYRVLAIIPAGILFVVLIPFFLICKAPSLDTFFGFPELSSGLPGLVVGGCCIAIGMSYALGSILSQLFLAKGTPLPVMPTQTLIISAPFNQCRNPMTFGTVLLYLGISIIVTSIVALGFALGFAALLIVYIRRVEEVEMEARFGEEYVAYKAQTPFLLPRLFRRED